MTRQGTRMRTSSSPLLNKDQQKYTVNTRITNYKVQTYKECNIKLIEQAYMSWKVLIVELGPKEKPSKTNR